MCDFVNSATTKSLKRVLSFLKMYWISQEMLFLALLMCSNAENKCSWLNKIQYSFCDLRQVLMFCFSCFVFWHVHRTLCKFDFACVLRTLSRGIVRFYTWVRYPTHYSYQSDATPDLLEKVTARCSGQTNTKTAGCSLLNCFSQLTDDTRLPVDLQVAHIVYKKTLKCVCFLFAHNEKSSISFWILRTTRKQLLK